MSNLLARRYNQFATFGVAKEVTWLSDFKEEHGLQSVLSVHAWEGKSRRQTPRTIGEWRSTTAANAAWSPVSV